MSRFPLLMCQLALPPAMFPGLRVRGRLQQHLRLRPDPRRQAGHAVLRVRGQRGKSRGRQQMPTADA